MGINYATNQNATAGGPAQDTGPGDDVAFCIQNIGPAEQSRRFRFGVVGLGFGLVLGALLIATGVNHWWRLVLFVPFAGAASGYFQARDKT